MNDDQTICEIAHGSPEYRATVDLRDAILRKPLGLEFSPEELEAEKDSHHVACYRSHRLVGCLVLCPLGCGDVRMRQLAVVPECQRQGIGKTLVEFAEALARKIGFRRMILHARETAVPFYEKLGYSRLGDQFEEVAIPHWAMEKWLTNESEASGSWFVYQQGKRPVCEETREVETGLRPIPRLSDLEIGGEAREAEPMKSTGHTEPCPSKLWVGGNAETSLPNSSAHGLCLSHRPSQACLACEGRFVW